ncbi:MAG: class II aldolase/adducin family protein [Dehalococcoidia bacterium]|nr:class II aldolase/adducin family protein [Dehalococcoidia bacterium]
MEAKASLELREKVAQSCRIMYMEGFFASSGHVSARIPGTDHILIHPRQTSRAVVEGKDLVAVDLRGRLVEGESEPPSETALHTAMYRARPDVMAVAHLHSHYATTISIAGRPLVPVFTPACIFAPEVPVFDDPSLIQNDAQGDAVAQVLGKGRAVLLRGHGSVVVAHSIEAVLAASVHFEENAKTLFDVYQIGTPRAITSDEAAPLIKQTWGDSSIMKVWIHEHAKARALGVL